MTHGLFAWLLTGSLLAMRADQPASLQKPQIEISSIVTMPGGPTPPVIHRVDMPTAPVVIYVYSGKTICDARVIGPERPTEAGNGWRLELRPAAIAAVKDTLLIAVQVTWQRLWEGGKPLVNGASGSTTVLMQPGSTMPIDKLDGDATRIARETAARLSAWTTGSDVPPEFAHDQVVVALLSSINKFELDKSRLRRDNGFGETHPSMVAIDAQIAAMHRPLDVRVRTLIATAIVDLAKPPTTTSGYAASAMTLQLKASGGTEYEPLLPWLGHNLAALRQSVLAVAHGDHTIDEHGRNPHRESSRPF